MKDQSDLSVHCPHSEICSACPQIHRSWADQKSKKMQNWSDLLASANILISQNANGIFLEESHLRNKLDFALDGKKIGLWSAVTQEIVDLDSCELLTPELSKLYEKFRKIEFSFQNKCSIRLRIGPLGQTGIWLDASHQDTKKLLENFETCEKLLKLGYVEIGQKFKKLELTGDIYKLCAAELHPWFESVQNNQWVPIKCYVGSFTQPGLKVHRLMICEIQKWLSQISAHRVFEYGCGIGNWTLALLDFGCDVEVTESDRASLTALSENIRHYGYSEKLNVLSSGFHQHIQKIDCNPDLCFLNPSRSGVGSLVKSIPVSTQWIIYISCFPESLIKDMQLLCSDFKLQESFVVDQFPLSDHYEVLSLWKRI